MPKRNETQFAPYSIASLCSPVLRRVFPPSRTCLSKSRAGSSCVTASVLSHSATSRVAASIAVTSKVPPSTVGTVVESMISCVAACSRITGPVCVDGTSEAASCSVSTMMFSRMLIIFEVVSSSTSCLSKAYIPTTASSRIAVRYAW